MVKYSWILSEKMACKILHYPINFLGFSRKPEKKEEIAHSLDEHESLKILKTNKMVKNIQVEFFLFTQKIAYCSLNGIYFGNKI